MPVGSAYSEISAPNSLPHPLINAYTLYLLLKNGPKKAPQFALSGILFLPLKIPAPLRDADLRAICSSAKWLLPFASFPRGGLGKVGPPLFNGWRFVHPLFNGRRFSLTATSVASPVCSSV
jgi:hypothetical protein